MKTPRSILTLALAFPAAKSNRNKSDTFKCAGPGPGPVSDCMYIECAIYSLDYVQSRHAHCSAAATALSRQDRQRERGKQESEASKQRQLRHTSDCSNHSSFIILSADLLPRPASLLSAPSLFSLSLPLSSLPSPSHCLPWTDPQLIFISLYFVAFCAAFVFDLLPNANCPAAYHASLMPTASLYRLPSPSPTSLCPVCLSPPLLSALRVLFHCQPQRIAYGNAKMRKTAKC